MSLPSMATERTAETSRPSSRNRWTILPAARSLMAWGRMMTAEQWRCSAGMTRSRDMKKASSADAASDVADTCTTLRTSSVPKRALRSRDTGHMARHAGLRLEVGRTRTGVRPKEWRWVPPNKLL